MNPDEVIVAEESAQVETPVEENIELTEEQKLEGDQIEEAPAESAEAL